MSRDRVFEFYRYGGTGGADDNDVEMMEASARQNRTLLNIQWQRRGFRGPVPSSSGSATTTER
jgi:hypothetical protein